jgi:ferritin
VLLSQIESPPHKFGMPLEVFEQALEHERFITRSIEQLFDVADQSTTPLLQWFATEQLEEEQTVGQIVESLRMAGDDGPALLLLDRELGTRRPHSEQS